VVTPARAVVKPRIVADATGAALPLEDEVARRLDAGRGGLLILRGAVGSGKTTALAHLAAVFPGQSRLLLLDDDESPAAWLAKSVESLVVCAESPSTPLLDFPAARLVGWGPDEWVEYLIAVAKPRCAAVLARIRPGDAESLGNSPEIWKAVLDELIADETHASAEDGLLAVLRRCFTVEKAWDRVQEICALHGIEALQIGETEAVTRAFAELVPSAACRLLRHQPVQQLLAVRRLAEKIEQDRATYSLVRSWPGEMIQRTAQRMRQSRTARSTLTYALQHRQQQPTAASLLLALDDCWKPNHGIWNFSKAALAGALWQGLRLESSYLLDTDLSGADLRDAVLDKAEAQGIDLNGARLTGARLHQIYACDGQFMGADLSMVRAERANFEGAVLVSANLSGANLHRAQLHRADLSSARLRHADLTGASLLGARITDADFTGANLELANLSGLPLRLANFSGACLQAANLTDCDWEEAELDEIDLSETRLDRALLTATVFTDGNLARASLINAGLADVNWAGVCLRGANLRGATFHLGSSRSGLVDSSIPCEGSRTGFYTDDLNEQDFKSPEEIRKANLCGADLRDACIDGVDFYLVDLRGALYTPQQRDYFTRCGAILEDRVPG